MAHRPPQLGADSFSCPHCGAIAHQHWFRIFVSGFKEKEAPSVIRYSEEARANIQKLEDERERQQFTDFLDRLVKHPVTINVHTYGNDSRWELINSFVSRCFSCRGYAIWIENKLLYPANESGVVPHEDMPPEVKPDFLEAASIVDQSPRSAAALLRLCIQKLMPVLGVQKENLNTAIGELVRQGLDPAIQKALDVVRVIGNNAVHPGEIDMKDDKATALQLFTLINLIVVTMISAKKQLEELYESLPERDRLGIAKRDGNGS